MPYSDNLYSMVDEDDSDVEPVADYGGYPFRGEPHRHQEEPETVETGVGQGIEEEEEEEEDLEHVLSPVDGYFGGMMTGSEGPSNVPRVPNIMVRDPTLEPGSTAESKAREARQESLEDADGDGVDDDGPVMDTAPQRAASSSPPPPSPPPTRPSSAHPSSPPTTSRSTYYQPSTAAYYSSRSRSPLSSPSYTSYAPRRSNYTPRSALLPTEAPPAYTPSPTTSDTSPTSPTAPYQGRLDYAGNYQTFSRTIMRRPEETQGLLAHQPESMGGPPDDESTPGRPSRMGRGISRRTVSVVLVLLLVTAGFLSAILSGKQEVPRPPTQRPPPQPPQPQKPGDPPSRVGAPPMHYPVYDNDTFWFPGSDACSARPKKQLQLSEDITFGPDKTLTIKQDVARPDDHDDPHYHPVEVTGDVVLRRSGQGTPGPSVRFEYLTNDDTLKLQVEWDADQQVFTVTVPRKLPWHGSVSRPCVAIRVTVWVPDGAVLDTLSVGTVHLGVRLLDNLALEVRKGAGLASVVGPITAATDGTGRADDIVDASAPASFLFHSRRIEAHTTAGHIAGYWPLYDYLGLGTTSGHVRVRVEPKDEDEDAPKPAVLNIKTTSGTIEAWEPVSQALQSAAAAETETETEKGYASSARSSLERHLPPRDYRVNVQSTSGSIRGSLAFSSAARIESTSGTTEVALLPLPDAAADSASNLETTTISGTMRVRVLGPLWVDYEKGAYLPCSPPPATPRALRSLVARHTSTSSTVRVQYPAVWEGELDLGSLSGRLRATGEGVRVIRSGPEWPGANRVLLARKGPGGGSGSTVRTVSGDVWVDVGGEEGW